MKNPTLSDWSEFVYYTNTAYVRAGVCLRICVSLPTYVCLYTSVIMSMVV